MSFSCDGVAWGGASSCCMADDVCKSLSTKKISFKLLLGLVSLFADWLSVGRQRCGQHYAKKISKKDDPSDSVFCPVLNVVRILQQRKCVP